MKPILGNDQLLSDGRPCAVLLGEGTPRALDLLNILKTKYVKNIEIWVSGDAAFWNDVSQSWQGKKRYLEGEERISLTFPAPPFEMDLPRCLLSDISIIPVGMNTVFRNHVYQGAIHALMVLLEKDRRHELEITYPRDTLLELYHRFGPLTAILPQPDGRPFLIGDAWSMDLSAISKIPRLAGKKTGLLRGIKGCDERLNFENIECFVSRKSYPPTLSTYKIRFRQVTTGFQTFVRGVFLVSDAIRLRLKRLMGRQMIKASLDCGKSLMINHPLRFHPPIRELKRLIAEGVLGEIQRVDMALGHKTRGGVLLDLGCHLIDLTLWIFGSIQHVEAVSAYEKENGGNRDVLHSVNVVLETGLPLSIRLSGSDRLQSYSATRLENEITVTGSLATCKASFDNPTLVLHQSNTVTLCKNKGARLTLRGIDRFEGSWRFFVKACDQKTSLGVMLQQAAETIYWIEKVYQITRRVSI